MPSVWDFYSACELVTPTNRLNWLNRTPLLPAEPVGGNAGAFTAVVCASVNEETSRWDQTKQAAGAAVAAVMVEGAVGEAAVAETVAMVGVEAVAVAVAQNLTLATVAVTASAPLWAAARSKNLVVITSDWSVAF